MLHRCGFVDWIFRRGQLARIASRAARLAVIITALLEGLSLKSAHEASDHL
jgi:hypothetical protein